DLFRLENIRPAPRGVPQIEVTFDIDANGILNVSARDKDTGTEQRITISESSNLDSAEVARMIADAEQHRDQDRLRSLTTELQQVYQSLATAGPGAQSGPGTQDGGGPRPGSGGAGGASDDDVIDAEFPPSE